MTSNHNVATSIQVQPIVSPGRCEAKGDCIVVCPYDVFEIIPIPQDVYRGLNFIEKIKSRVHGMKIAATPNAERCLACGLCVKACPEKAIKLVERGA